VFPEWFAQPNAADSQLAIHGNLEFTSTVLVADPVSACRSFQSCALLGDVCILETERVEPARLHSPLLASCFLSMRTSIQARQELADPFVLLQVMDRQMSAFMICSALRLQSRLCSLEYCPAPAEI
jgi:hypothetical protein